MTAENIHKLEDPIDVMPLMHKAFRAVSDRTEALAAKASTFEDIAELKEAFGYWVKQILYHATVEDEVMTGPLKNSQPARDNEAEHAELAGKAGELAAFIAKGKAAGLEESVRDAAFTLEEAQHKELEERFHEVESALQEVLGEKKVTARTIRHIHSRLIGVRILELDHFENEEAFVVSLVRDEVDEAGQLYIIRRLLIDESAEDPRWIIDWVYSELDSADQALLKDLETRFQAAVAQPA
ncbi:MAG: hemerythrin domain-containing protein [Chloroflexi bacterium]|nr:hemerythrin domain-containing protein [Chloroflexota bacterium]MCH8800033.1 hemerythrin domain-containing protein [Chloroflexota bacterium]MCH8892460.1 hemerythrin domain-containing protein [Chloroflexota bacterium]MCH9017045.1 hemerythrin domain-containing protein [Chloroflexota bacterium]MCI0788976.1 hemerythrin domain-containing protein [Chloroflexota bacterium]